MSENSSSPSIERRKTNRGGDLVIPLLAVGFTLYYLWSIKSAPWTAKVATYMVAGVLLLLVLIAFVRIALEVRRGLADLGFSRLLSPLELMPRRLMLMLLTIAYVALIEWSGFTLTTLVYLFLAMLLLGAPRMRALWVSLAYATGGYLLFIAAFDTRFPAGPFETLMKGLG